MWKSLGQCGRVRMYTKKQHLLLIFLPKANVKNDKYDINLSNPPTWSSCFSNINVEAIIKYSNVKRMTYSVQYLCK